MLPFMHLDSALAQMCDAIIDYVVGKDLLEPLGGAPTSSIILQVAISLYLGKLILDVPK